MSFSGPDLARRLERAEAGSNAALVEARQRLQPESGACWQEVAGAYALFDGVSSPLTQSFGLGLFDPFGNDQFDQIEAFFLERGSSVFHEVSPFIAAETLACLHARHYRPIEHSTVLVRDVAIEPSSPSHIAVRCVEVSEAEQWSRVAATGWSSESAELAAFVETLGSVSVQAHGMHCFLAEIGGAPVAAAALSIVDDIALLAGASTIPTERRRGAQLAMLEERLRFAAGRGATLAMMVATPGSGSQRNAERHGFRSVYTRTKWRRDRRGV